MNNLRVVLLNPPTAPPSPEPLLNLGYLAAVLRARGHDVRIVDGTAPHAYKSPEEIEKIISQYCPDFIGITLTITNVIASYEYIRNLKKHNIPVVLGGPHPNSRPHESLDNGGDIVCIGEGEGTILELAEYYQGQRELKTVKGICFKDEGGKIVFTEPRSLIKELDTLPFPDFKDFRIEDYSGSSDPMSNPIFWSVFSSRGCPFNCIFCSSHTAFGRTMRVRSAENVFGEIKSLVEKYKIQSVAFQDDEILCKKDRFYRFCDLIAESGLKLKMSIRTRIDSIDLESLQRAKQAGITRISFGIESWDDETLRKINKRYDVKTIHQRFGYLSQTQPIHISFNVLVGFPWENRKHYQNILNEIKKIPGNVRFFMIVVYPIPYPETKLYDDYHKQFGFTDWWLDSTKHNPLTYPPSHSTRPFFVYFAGSFIPLYVKDLYWNYSKERQADIEWFSWAAFKVFSRRHFNLFEYVLVTSLCRVSYWLSSRNKKLEYRILAPLANLSYFKNLRDKVSFSNKY
ncbi:MAG: radical SAM protein [Pseudomonadota bacterium]